MGWYKRSAHFRGAVRGFADVPSSTELARVVRRSSAGRRSLPPPDTPDTADTPDTRRVGSRHRGDTVSRQPINVAVGLENVHHSSSAGTTEGDERATEGAMRKGQRGRKEGKVEWLGKWRRSGVVDEEHMAEGLVRGGSESSLVDEGRCDKTGRIIYHGLTRI